MACGIYRITNLNNGKKYIGQSRNIYARWKQHTQSLSNIQEGSLTPLRHAFVKYGLKKQVSSEGIHDNFLFEIVCECVENELNDREYDLIAKERPEYNIQYQEPSIDKLWPQRDRLKSACYIQYHNFEKMDGYPFEGIFFENIDTTYIVSKKRDALRCKGEKVYLLLGIKCNSSKKKQYYLWGYTFVEEIEVTAAKEYALCGSLRLCRKPQLLNNLDGFEKFARVTTGSFAFGLQNVVRDEFSKTIESLCTENKLFSNESVDKEKYLEWLYEFERDNKIDDDKALTELRADSKAVVSFFNEVNDDNEFELRYRTIGWAISYPNLLIEYMKNDKEYENIHALICDPMIEVIKTFPNRKYFLYYFPDEKIDERYYKLMDMAKIEFREIGP